MMTNRFIALLFFVLFIPFNGQAQSKDTKLWTGLSIEKKISKKFKGSIELEQRFENSISSFDRLLIEPTISYKLNKIWAIELSYRLWYQKEKSQNYFFHNRVSIGLIFSKKIDDLKLKLSSKFQYGIQDRIEADFYATKKLLSRNSIKLSYDIFGSPFTPFLKYELFTSLKKLKPLNNQWRLIGGTHFYINKKNTLKLYYAREHEFNIVNRKNANIWGIALQHSL